MLQDLARFLTMVIGGVIGYGIGSQIYAWGQPFDHPFAYLILTIGTADFFLITAYFFYPRLSKGITAFVKGVESELSKVPTYRLGVGTAGLIAGLAVAFLISPVIQKIEAPSLGLAISILSYLILGYLGSRIAAGRAADVVRWPEKKRTLPKATRVPSGARVKILDTSVVIDGRILDIMSTGFIEGTVMIPEFVLKELQHIADSSDSLKRVRGRRGLDILKSMQDSLSDVQISPMDFEDVEEVDSKLLRMAKEIDGIVVTNDFNLNKVAGLQDIPVLNINDLANAVKSVVLPGEEMVVQIIKEGKEAHQGVAYLDDGTMIVVEGARKRMNETIEVTVTSVLQTSAGRMIFARTTQSQPA